MTKPQGYPEIPKAFWDRFYEITQVPRPSSKEEKMMAYLKDSATSAGFKFAQDKIGNVVIYVPASTGYEDKDTVILQGHMDMVCEKFPQISFDFENDPIDLKVEDGWICANGTTLGADNGFGCAAALAIMDEKNLKHPPLELLFTVDEERGLNGALNLDVSMLRGKKMLNLDSEDWGTIYIGCTGGVEYKLGREYSQLDQRPDSSCFLIEVSGLVGGHSGMNIHLGGGNAIKIISELLWEMKEMDFELEELTGGGAHNVIPRDAVAIVHVNSNDIEKVQNICKENLEKYQKFLPGADKDLKISCSQIQPSGEQVFAPMNSKEIVDLVNIFPHGAHSYDWEMGAPTPKCSSNLATCRIKDGKLELETSIRFLNKDESRTVEKTIESISEIFSLKFERDREYPSWIPATQSKLLDIAKDAYMTIFDQDAQVRVVHAGLECGIIKEKLNGLGEIDVISIGPNIRGVHSPYEKLEIESSSKFWQLLTGILGSI